MSTPADSAAAQLRLCQHHERRLQRQLDSSESILAQQKETLEMHGQRVEAIEKSGAADLIDQLDQLAVLEESMDSDIRRTQDTIMDLRRRLHDARMSTIAASAAIHHHEAEPATSSLTPSTADEMLRADPVTVDTQALDDAEHLLPPAAVPDGAVAAAATDDTAILLLTEQTVHEVADFALDQDTLTLPDTGNMDPSQTFPPILANNSPS